MRITFSDARVWRYVMAGVGKFIESGLAILNSDGFIFKAIDPSRVSLIEMFTPRESFDTFEVENELEAVINVDELGKILRSSERDDKISLEFGENSLRIEFERKNTTREFLIPLQVGSEAEAIPELKLELNNRFKVSGPLLYESISSIEDLGDVLIIKAFEEGLSLMIKSDLGEAEVVFDSSRGALIEREVNEPDIEVSYGLEYFTYIKLAMRISENVDLLLGSEMPCKLVFNLPQGVKMNYYVAPRIE
ncbi:MAG: hypothetical protein QW596_00840 [Sulfolobales archaeon]